MRTFRLFISSPGDAAVERRRAESVVSRLNGEFAGVARLTTVRWETEFYGAHATFQTQIPAAAECDLVVGILRWRLGTELPPGFADRLPGGEPYPSGTAYELLTAIDKRRTSGELPDVFVFRYAGGSPNPELDDPDRAAIERDWAALRGFFARWFLSEQGHFLAAMNSYGSEDDFEHQLESLLRKWLAEKVAGGRSVPWPATKGSPFRGLGVFGVRHAPVFFGRAGDIRRAMDLWRAPAAAGTRFLLIVGASGAGKSSLARAGLIPRLTTAGVVPDVDLWRVAAMRPGDSSDGPLMALAAALLQGESTLPPEEDGRGPALPEIADGDHRTPADLADVLAHADAGAVRVITNALARIGQQAADADRRSRALRCGLVLLVDQLDELFAASLTSDIRGRFADLLAALVASGQVWLVATLRADLYAPMLDLPALKGLKDGGASYDLTPPGAAGLAEIVRALTLAAGLVFDQVAATGERLDELLLREADRPDMLPLVQLALSRLWDARETRGAETVLTFSAFERLGGVKGIVEEAGETALAALGASERVCLPALIRGLAEHSHGQGGVAGTLTARALPLAAIAPGTASRALVDALVAARLLTLVGEGGATSVRLAHQRVLSDWARAASVVAESADFYRVRDEIETQRDRWEASRRRGEFLLPRGLPLAEAREMAAKYGAELSPEMRAFIAASRRRANRAQVAAWTAASVFALLALGAGVAARVAFVERVQAETQRQEAEHQKEEAQRQRAEADRQKEEAERQKQAADHQKDEADRQKRVAQRNFRAAKATVDGLIFNIAQGLQNVAGVRIETIRIILDTAQGTVNDLLATSPDDPQLLRSQSVMLNNFAATYIFAGDLKDAAAAATQSVGIARRLLARDPGSAQAQRDLSVSLERLGDVRIRVGDQIGALAAQGESLDIRRKLAAPDSVTGTAQRDVAVNLNKIGDLKLQAGDQAGALAAYLESLDIVRKLAARDPGAAQGQRDVAVSLNKIGDEKRLAGDLAGALAAYAEGLDIVRKLAAQDPGNAQVLRDVSISLNKIGDGKMQGGDRPQALMAYEEGLGIVRRLAAQDPGNAQAQRDVYINIQRIGDVKFQGGDRAGAAAAFRESLDIARRLATQDPGNAQARRDVSIGLNKVGDEALLEGDPARALAAYEEGLDIARKLAAQDPGNAQAQRDVYISLQRIGDAKLGTGDRIGAAAAIKESLDIARMLAAQDTGSAQARRDLALGLERTAEADMKSGDHAGALAAWQESLDITRKLAAQDPGDAQIARDFYIDLQRIGDLKLSGGDRAGASAAFRESLDIARRLAVKAAENAQAQRDLALSLARVAKVETMAGDRAGALAASQEDVAIVRRLAAENPENLDAQRDLAEALAGLGTVEFDGGDPAGALVAGREMVGIRRRIASRMNDDRSKAELAQALGLTAIPALMTRDFTQALALSDEAITLDPKGVWLSALRAHALMLLGRTDQARTEYLQNRGRAAPGALSWEQTVEAGFVALRKAGISDPLMAEIEAEFAKSSTLVKPKG